MSDILMGALVGLVVSVGMWAPYIIITEYKRKFRRRW